ncbi:MAG TPA: multiheme c-type cytochrome [Anaerolineales bacterium]|nr:multiheme c-type cytochrome [Anaerolineales bacterium]
MSENFKSLKGARLLIFALTIVVAVLGVALALQAMSRATAPTATAMTEGDVNALEGSTDSCVTCHQRTTPGIVEQYGHSTMAAAKVTCQDCHEVKKGYPGSTEHEGTYILQQPTTAMCQSCHQAEVAQFQASRHALPSYVAYAGSKDLSAELLAQYQAIPEGQFAPDKSRNIIYHLEGEAITQFACETCHDVGKPAIDNSVGQCSSCHLRHEFSLEQVRKPETCNACHIGPDHPQWEIYEESPHGIAYHTGGEDWNWSAEPGTLTVNDFPAPTCQTCHFSGFGASGTTHDAGERLTWYLFAPISERRPAYQDNAVRMQNVCKNCHNPEFVSNFYTDADKVVEQVNLWVTESNTLMKTAKENKLVDDEPFNEEFDYEHYELWHHWGRTAKFGAWMGGPDYTQWHGAYELIKSRSALIEMLNEGLVGLGLPGFEYTKPPLITDK